MCKSAWTEWINRNNAGDLKEQKSHLPLYFDNGMKNGANPRLDKISTTIIKHVIYSQRMKTNFLWGNHNEKIESFRLPRIFDRKSLEGVRRLSKKFPPAVVVSRTTASNMLLPWPKKKSTTHGRLPNRLQKKCKGNKSGRKKVSFGKVVKIWEDQKDWSIMSSTAICSKVMGTVKGGR